MAHWKIIRTFASTILFTLIISFIMKISHIEHLGIAVQSIEEALPYFKEVLGLECYAIETVEDQKVKTAFLKCGEVKLELLEPTSPESTIQKGSTKVTRVYIMWLSALRMVWLMPWQKSLRRAYASSTKLLAKVPRT